MYGCDCVRACVCACMCVCVNATCILSLKLCTFCDVVKRVDLCKNMLSGETSLIKAESLYAYYTMLIQRINFLICMHVCVFVIRCVCTQCGGGGGVGGGAGRRVYATDYWYDN